MTLYAGGQVIGGLGVSGDNSCADPAVAHRKCKVAKLDEMPDGVGPNGRDNISYAPSGAPPAGFQQPRCFPTDITP